MSKPMQMLPPKPRVEFTAELKERFLEEYGKTALRAQSAALCGIALRTFEEHYTKDLEFRERVREAKRLYVENVYVAQARMFALEGVEEPIIGGQFRDEIVAYKKNLSTDMLKFLIRRDDATFRDGAERQDEDGTGQTQGESGLVGIVLPGKAMSNDDWKQRYQNAARGLKADGTPYDA